MGCNAPFDAIDSKEIASWDACPKKLRSCVVNAFALLQTIGAKLWLKKNVNKDSVSYVTFCVSDRFQWDAVNELNQCTQALGSFDAGVGVAQPGAGTNCFGIAIPFCAGCGPAPSPVSSSRGIAASGRSSTGHGQRGSGQRRTAPYTCRRYGTTDGGAYGQWDHTDPSCSTFPFHRATGRRPGEQCLHVNRQ